MEEEIICNRHRDLADAVMNAVPTRRREGNRRRAQLTEDDGKAMTVTTTDRPGQRVALLGFNRPGHGSEGLKLLSLKGFLRSSHVSFHRCSLDDSNYKKRSSQRMTDSPGT